MQVRSVLIWLAGGLLLAGLLGCNGGDGGVPGFRVTGRLLNFITGEPVPNAQVALLENGTLVRSFLTDTQGNFTMTNVPAGSYTLRATRASDSLVPTYYGPITVSGLTPLGELRTVTELQTEALFGLAPPPAGTASLVVLGLNENDELVPVQVSVGNIATVTPAAPVLLPVVDPGTYTVTVTANGQTRTLTNVVLESGGITLVQAPFIGIAPSTVNITGQVVNFFSGEPLSGASVFLLQGSTQVAGPVLTDAGGDFLFTNVAPGQGYRLRVEGAELATTVYGPVAVTAGVTPAPVVPVPALTELALNEGITTPPAGTARLVVYAEDAQGVGFQPVVRINGTLVPDAVPPFSADLTPGVYTIDVTDPSTTITATLTNVTLTGGVVTVLQAQVR